MRPRKLSTEQAAELVALAASGTSHRDLGRRFGVSHTTVANVIKRGTAGKKLEPSIAGKKLPASLFEQCAGVSLGFGGPSW